MSVRAAAIVNAPELSPSSIVKGSKSVQIISPFWLILWSVTLAAGWLLPNHYPPWSTFHFDAWSAAGFAIVSAPIILRSKERVQWSGAAIIIAALSLVPFLQYLFGLVTQAGNAWISTGYMLGLLMSVLIGTRWEMAEASQLGDGLFLAIGIASVLSVGLQLHQWLMLDLLDIWSMGEGFGRPFANFGQPNQLGTFLLWGLLATLWGYVRARLSGPVAICLALYLLFGLALTSSRTAWIGCALVICAAWYWHRDWPDRHVPLILTLLGLYLAACTLAIVPLTRFVFNGLPFDIADIARIGNESRPAIWSTFVDAASHQILLGYGWNQVTLAQFRVAETHPLHTIYAHSHNLFLDLVLWTGFPVGLATSSWLVWWLWKRSRQVTSAENAILVLFLLVVGNHAMLELPLHHAYFLLPVGLVMGSLDVRLGGVFFMSGARLVLGCLWALLVGLLCLILKDYSVVEPEYRTLRFEWAHIRTAPPTPPQIIMLTQWRDFIHMARLEPTEGMPKSELQWMRDVTGLYPSGGFVQRLATALALNQLPEEAALWLHKFCNMATEDQCEGLKRAWARQARGNEKIAAVQWP